ncbi:MAG: endonuclease/exonuclease/phosphatase family protein, partial [Desulfofustis sp.]|nr:endonuclease/exonuclease/phosphatase family protein [Desulfofustis sp.]
MFTELGRKWRSLRRRFSPGEWAARQIRPERSGDRGLGVNAPGILMIQVDGLSHHQLRQALEKKRLPFLSRLLRQDHFVLKEFYSGLPSTTPAVQAELFFGKPSVVPAFMYYNRAAQRETTMFDAQAVDDLARTLEKHSDALLRGGSSYANIFAGGAEEAPFCIQSMNLRSIFRGFKITAILWFIVVNLGKIARIIGLGALEAALAIGDFCIGVYRRRNPFKELKFIFSRIGVCIVLRELVRLHVKIDLARGLPIIHANFVGYDEHAHRRGPGSAFAMWTLKGIDGTIKDLVRSARWSEKRDCRVFIYSDHGQEACLPYERETGRTIHQAVADVFRQGSLQRYDLAEPDSAVIPHISLQQRSRGLFRGPVEQSRPIGQRQARNTDRIHLTALGPLGHIYLPERPDAPAMQHYAETLVSAAAVPLVLYRHGEQIICVSPAGHGELSVMAPQVFGEKHPFLTEVTRDLGAICRHENGGDFIISGWRPHHRSLSFVVENGSHGGPGSTETRGFLILPDTLTSDDHRYFRPGDLRQLVATIRNQRLPAPLSVARTLNELPELITVMSYNIHHCRGLDGKLFPDRIARIIDRQKPDIVALQEVDRNRGRTEYLDQAAELGRLLGMDYRFLPLLDDQAGEYGLAVLSRYPLTATHYTHLPQIPGKRRTERRGILRVTIATRHGPVHLCNTHLSLIRKERLAQMCYLVDDFLTGEIPEAEPVIVCGDLNASLLSPAYRLLSTRLSDAHRMSTTDSPEPTFLSSYPLVRLDHIFASRHLVPIRGTVVRSGESRLAS